MNNDEQSNENFVAGDQTMPKFRSLEVWSIWCISRNRDPEQGLANPLSELELEEDYTSELQKPSKKITEKHKSQSATGVQNQANCIEAQ